jgi:flagellar FliL protein
MKPLFIALMTIIVLGGASAGGYFYFQKPAIAAIDASEDGGKNSFKKIAIKQETKEYVELDPLVLPILDKNGVNQILSLVVVIEVNSEETAKEVEYLSPRLKDAFIQNMYGVLTRKTVLADGVLRVDVVKKLLNKVSDKVLGEDIAQDVLLKVVQQRPM